MFPEYLWHTYANDIYYIGNSIQNNNMDKGLKVVFKLKPYKPETMKMTSILMCH